jgi:HNH endonuclease
MEIIGLKVKHSVFGVGVIVERNDDYITVEFATKTGKFMYPDAFEKFMKVEDPDMQLAIVNIIKNSKETNQKHQDEETTYKVTEEQRCMDPAVVAPKTEKSKTLNAMFAPDYHVEKMARHPIFTYRQVEAQFGIRISGFGRGINSTDNTVVLISSIGKANGNFVYHDKWTVDGDYLYSGEGKTGDQTMTKGNLAIRDAARNEKKIHLFIKFSPQEYYYQGVFELVDYTYENDKDKDGEIRKEYKFRLRKVSGV